MYSEEADGKRGEDDNHRNKEYRTIKILTRRSSVYSQEFTLIFKNRH